MFIVCSQEPVAGPYPDPDACTHIFSLYFPKIPSKIILQYTPISSSGSFPSGFPAKILYAYLIYSSQAH